MAKLQKSVSVENNALFFVPKTSNAALMIGRDSQLQAIEQLLDQPSDKPKVVLITGEAGIGKSRLVAELTARIRPRYPNLLMLAGRCFETDQGLPYAPFSDLLHAYLDNCTPETRQLTLSHVGYGLAHLLPEFASNVNTRNASPSANQAVDKRQLFYELYEFIVSQSHEQSIWLTIEDLHWTDDTSLEFLIYLLHHAAPSLTLLLTYRSDEIQPSLGEFLAELDRMRVVTEFTLARLNINEVGVLIRAILQLTQPVQLDFLNSVYQLTEGNPFFIEEILASLISSGDLFYVDGHWDRKPLHQIQLPRTVEVAVQRRLTQLSAEARSVLIHAAVTGQRFDFTLLAQLMHKEENELLEVVRELLKAKLVVEETEESFAFRHALTRQAIYNQLLGRERRNLHKQIAEVLNGLFAASPSPEQYLADLSYHYFEAGDWAKALGYAWQAGERAQQLYSPRAALEHFSRAIEASRKLNQPAPMPLLQARGKTYEILGDFVAAEHDYEAVLEAARKSGERRVEWQSLLDLGFLNTGLNFARASDYFQTAIIVAREMNEPFALGQSLNRVGNWYMNQDQPLEAIPYHQEALKIFEALDNPKELASTLDLLGVTHVVSGDMVASARYYDRAIPIFRQLDDRIGLSSALAVNAIHGGNCMEETTYCLPVTLEYVLVTSTESYDIAHEIGWRTGEVAADMYAGYALVLYGEFELCLKVVYRALDTAQSIQHPLYHAASQMTLGRLYNEIFAFDVAQDLLTQALTVARKMNAKFLIASIAGFLASSYLGLDDKKQAGNLLNDYRAGKLTSVGQRIICCADAELAITNHDYASAIKLIDTLCPLDVAGKNQVVPRLNQLKARALMGLGQVDEALELLQAADEDLTKRGMQSTLWRVLADLSHTYRVLGDRQQMIAVSQRAKTIVDELTAKIPDSTQRHNYLSHATNLIAPIPAPTPRQSVKSLFDGLTTREREIAVRIAQGQSNRLIAQELVLSQRTVDAHVGNILSKLGFASRSQITRWAIEKGLLK